MAFGVSGAQASTAMGKIANPVKTLMNSGKKKASSGAAEVKAPVLPPVQTEKDPTLLRNIGVDPATQRNVMQNKPGKYNAEKGGFEAESGQFYPTQNPDFKPSAESTKIKFNEDNTVDFTPIGGDTINLSKAEWNVVNGKAGAVTDKVQQVQAGQQQVQQQPFQSLSQEQVQQEAAVGVPQADLTGGLLGDSLEMGANIIESFGSFLPEFLQFGTKKSVGVTKAEAMFADNSVVLDKQIQAYQQGLIPRSVVDQSIRQSEKAIIELERQTKGLGQANLRFWLDQGREIEAQIQRELVALEMQKQMLNLGQVQPNVRR